MAEHRAFIPVAPPEGLSHNDLMPVRRRDGKLAIIKGPALRAAEDALLPWLANNRPPRPVDEGGVPVAVDVRLAWEADADHPGGSPMAKAPDWDNAAKVVCDLLQRTGWLEDDRHVVDGRVAKLHAPHAGVFVEVRAIDDSEEA